MEEKNKTGQITFGTYAVIVTIVFLVLLVGILAGMLIQKNQDEKVTNTNKNVLAENKTDKENAVESDKDKTNNEEKKENNSKEEMTTDLAYNILKKYKEEKLKDAGWKLGKVELVAHGDNDTYLVGYEEINDDGYTDYVSTIIEYKNGKWTTDLPGSSGYSDDFFEKYNFVMYEDKEISSIKGEKLIQFDNKFYELKDVAKDYRLSENIKNYKDFSFDLDGDGVKDKITIQKNKENKGESYLFKLNGKEFAQHYYRPEIYIVDLNEKDCNIEVVIFDQGPSDDPGYIIYSKKGNKMVEIERMSGYPLRIDKKGTIIIDDYYNGITSPKIYFDFYSINNSKIERKSINIDKVKDKSIQTEWLYFSKDFKNVDRFNQEGGLSEQKLKKFDIEKIDKSTTFKLLDYKVTKNKNDIKEYKIYVKLSDGREGYIFHIQWAG